MIDVDISFFQLIFYNYTEAAGPSAASPTASRSTRTPADIFLDNSSCADSVQQELAELRQQLQPMKKQVVTVMDQSRKSSEREKAALRQAQEALELKECAVADALRATAREDYMLELMTEACQDMVGVVYLSFSSTFLVCFLISCFSWLNLGSFLDVVTEDQRVNTRFEILLQLAKQNGIDFWASEDRTRQIVRFQDRAAQIRKFRDFFGGTLAMIYI
jgi:hypothetical protein